VNRRVDIESISINNPLKIVKNKGLEGILFMANPEKIIVRIVSVQGTCAAGHHVGQEFDLSKDFLLGLSGNPQALCPSAFHAIFPSWRVLRHGGEYPWEEDRDKTAIACPDPINPVVMELRRIKE
jgi:uncharacterized repeat protein (TIGR04076 family)